MILSTLSANVLSLALLHVLPILQFCPPVPPATSAGIIANTVINLGSGKLADQQEVHAFPAGDSNTVFLQD